MSILIVSFLLIYVFCVFILLMVSFATPNKKYMMEDNSSDLPTVSVVVPFRNESKNLINLLSDLQAIDYPKEFLEIWLINDHSTDDSEEIIQQFLNQNDKKKSFHLLSLSLQKEGKKAALLEGARHASGSYLLFTDADCRIEPLWVRSMLSLAEEDIKLVLGPVELTGSQILQKLQTVEYWTLMQITHTAVELKQPFLANGANLLVKTTVFLELYEALNHQYASGDDVFLLQAVYRQYGASAIAFNGSKYALVRTAGMATWHDLLQQRRRWVSKIRKMQTPGMYWSSALTLLGYSVLAGVFMLLLSGYESLAWWIFVWKIGADIVFVLSNAVKRNKIPLLVWMPLLELVYPFYQIGLLLTAYASSIEWKGRDVKNT